MTTGSGGGIADESDLESEGGMCRCMCVCGCCETVKLSFVTGFGKTDHNVTTDISRNTNLKY